MYITIDNASQFRDAFHKAGRGNQFSYEGVGLLFDYLEEVNPDYELDVVELCCEYSEDTPDSIADYYAIDTDVGIGTIAAQVLEYLNNNTSVVGVTSTGAIVYVQF